MPKGKKGKDAQGAELPRLAVPREKVAEEMEERILLGREFLERPIASKTQLDSARRDYYTWNEYNAELLRRRFTTPSVAEEYEETVGFAVIGGEYILSEEIEDFHRDVNFKLRRLESVVERLPLIDELAGAPVRAKAKAEPGAAVFIVHGRNEGRKQEVARFLDSLLPSNPPVILHEQPNEGRTVIEKFEDHAQKAAYAVVLFTGDDEGRLAGEGTWSLRPRQNVVLELGFFFGALGRSHVAVLYEEGVERPSDIEGLLYVPLDPAGAWRMQLAKELEAVGLSIDANALLRR